MSFWQTLPPPAWVRLHHFHQSFPSAGIKYKISHYVRYLAVRISDFRVSNTLIQSHTHTSTTWMFTTLKHKRTKADQALKNVHVHVVAANVEKILNCVLLVDWPHQWHTAALTRSGQ